MKRFLALAALVLGVVSCQTEPEGLDVIVGGEVDTVVTVTIPEAETRANSAEGAFENVVNSPAYTIRYIFAVYYGETCNRQVKYSDDKSVAFDVRLVPDRDYQFVVWADVVAQNGKVDGVYANEDGLHYDTSDLKAITLKNWDAMDETRDAFTGTRLVEDFNGSQGITVNLTRPFAKLRVMTTDMEELEKLDLTPEKVVVNYNTDHYSSFNAFAGQPFDKTVTKSHTIADVATYGEYGTLFVDYFFATVEQEAVQFDITVYDQNGDADVNRIKYNNFNTDIPVKRNFLTTIKGNVLTDGNNIKVEVEDGGKFDGEIEEPVVEVATAEAAQAALDRATDGDIIKLVPGVNYGTLYIRPTASNNTTMRCEDFTTTDAEEFKQHLSDGAWHPTPRYTTIVKNLTILGATGATVNGFVVTSGHAVGDVYDYVRDIDYNSGSAYYSTMMLENIKFTNVAFTGRININTSDVNSVYDGITFEGCTFTTGGTEAANNAAIRYYDENNTGNVRNITVKDCTFNNCYQGVYTHYVSGVTVTGCTFTTTGHNAIAMQSSGNGPVNLKNVVITDNRFENIADRIIRFNNVGADSNITIQRNVAVNSGDENKEVIKATSIATGVVTSVKYNHWGDGAVVANPEFRDTAAEVTSAAELQSIVNAATNDMTIEFGADLTGKISLTQNHDIDITIDGKGKNYTGGIHIWGNGASDDRSMTIKNINFDGTGLTGDEGCIYTTGAVNGRNSYACNVTIEDCTFTGAGVAAIRQNVAGEKDWTIRGCTVDSTMHSLLQVSNTNGELIVEDCKVYSKNGANLNSTCVATFTDCEFDVRGYAVRVGVNSGGNPGATKVYTFNNCTLKSHNEDGDAVITVRKDAEKATVKLNNTTLIGTPAITDVATLKVSYNGYTKLANYPNIYVKDNGYYVFDVAGLKDLNNYFIANSMNNHLWSIEYNIGADIDATGFTWNGVYVVVGNNDNHGIVLNGNNHTISNLIINNCLLCGTPCGSNAGVRPGLVKDITMKDVVVNGSSHDAAIFWGNCNTNVDFENVTVDGASITGGSNVGALVSRTSIEDPNKEIKVNFKNCVVKNSTLEADNLNADPTGASGFIGRAYGKTQLTFEDCSVENNTINNANGLVGGAVYGYTTWYGNGFYGTGACDTFTNWNGLFVETVAEGLLKKDSAYVVMNAEGLAALNAMMVNKTAGKAVKVTLGADIDFAGKTWTPVDSFVDSPFYFSELDGSGYTITNLTINGQAMFTRFAGSGNVTIKNVTFDNAKVNSNGNINTSILTVQTYQNVLLDNVDVKNSTIIGGYKVAPLIATVYNEGASTITATLKNCDVENTVVKATSYDFCTAGMVAFVYEGDNDHILFENCSVKDVQLYAPNVYTAHAAIYTAGSETLYNEVEGVVVENVTFENI